MIGRKKNYIIPGDLLIRCGDYGISGQNLQAHNEEQQPPLRRTQSCPLPQSSKKMLLFGALGFMGIHPTDICYFIRGCRGFVFDD